MVDVVSRVVDGDGAGAVAALAALPADAHATAEVKFAEGAALQAQGKWRRSARIARPPIWI